MIPHAERDGCSVPLVALFGDRSYTAVSPGSAATFEVSHTIKEIRGQ
jgi:hypothetical protein